MTHKTTTELDALCYNVGDRIVLTDDIPGSNTISCLIESMATAGGVTTFDVSEPLDWTFANPRVYLRYQDGKASRLFVASPTGDNYQVSVPYQSEFADGGTGRNELIICNNVKARRISNDGFGQHAPVGGVGKMILNGCDGSYNGDQAGQSAQGASNHEFTKMVINGGTFNFNVSGGMVAIENAQCDIHGDTKYGPVVMDGNMRLGNTAGTIASQAGCAWLNYATGIVTGDVTVKNGHGVGVRRGPDAVVEGIATIRSVNNALPDIL